MLTGQKVTLWAMTRDDLERLCQFNNGLEVSPSPPISGAVASRV